MKKVIFSAIIFVFLFIRLSFAQTSIKAEVDKTTIDTDGTLTYKLIITSSDKKLPQPTLPKFEKFSIISRAESSSISFGESGAKTILVYTYILVPQNIGKIKIEPSVIKIKDKTYSTDTFEIEVTGSKAKPKPKLKQKPSLPKRFPAEESAQPQFTL